MGETIERRAAKWIAGRDTGLSSKAIWARMMGVDGETSYPSDGGDFGRCHRLLYAIPEWRARLPEMSPVSQCWAALVPRWDELTRVYTDDTANKTDMIYKLMKAILDPIVDRDPHVIRFGSNATISFR